MARAVFFRVARLEQSRERLSYSVIVYDRLTPCEAACGISASTKNNQSNFIINEILSCSVAERGLGNFEFRQDRPGGSENGQGMGGGSAKVGHRRHVVEVPRLGSPGPIQSVGRFQSRRISGCPRRHFPFGKSGLFRAFPIWAVWPDFVENNTPNIPRSIAEILLRLPHSGNRTLKCPISAIFYSRHA